MDLRNEENHSQLSIEERRLRLDEIRLLQDNSFAKKWLPMLVTLMVGLIAGMFSWVQQQKALQATAQVRIQEQAKDEREWGFKVVEMYFSKRDLFDLSKNSDEAASNLRVLAVVAPKAVQGVLNAEGSKIPPPGAVDDKNRLEALAAVAKVQDALASARPSATQGSVSGFKPTDFTIYVQYPENGRDTAAKAQRTLQDLGYRVPGIHQVREAPSRLQVRYYRPDQQSYAGGLATELGKSLGLPATSDNAILVTNSSELPTGILEVWLPR